MKKKSNTRICLEKSKKKNFYKIFVFHPRKKKKLAKLGFIKDSKNPLKKKIIGLNLKKFNFYFANGAYVSPKLVKYLAPIFKNIF